MWLPVTAAFSFVPPATLLLVYVITAVLGALDGAAIVRRATRRWVTRATVAVGAICFISTAADLYYALAGLWLPTALFAWGYLVAGVAALAVVAACAAVLLVCWGLKEEIHRWQWSAFAAPAGTAIWALAYGVHFVVTKTKAAGVCQVAYAVM
jgi:hypothetical protein